METIIKKGKHTQSYEPGDYIKNGNKWMIVKSVEWSVSTDKTVIKLKPAADIDVTH
jgi:hypothetical protein